VIVEKNYLSQKEIRGLESTVSAYFDYVERLLEDETLLIMKDIASSNDEFIKFNRYESLEGQGHITHSAARQKAIGEYKEFNKLQKISLILTGRLKRYKESRNE
jgi:hypothetical protein